MPMLPELELDHPGCQPGLDRSPRRNTVPDQGLPGHHFRSQDIGKYLQAHQSRDLQLATSWLCLDDLKRLLMHIGLTILHKVLKYQ